MSMTTPAYAEEAVISGVMANNGAFHDIAGLIAPEHFTSPLRSRLWTAIRDRILDGEAADPVTVMESLPDDASEIMDIAKSYATARTVPTYAAIVRENWRRREASGIAMRLLSDSRNNEEGAVDTAIAALLALNSTVTEHEFTGRQVLQMAFDVSLKAHESGGRIQGIPTGLTELDDILGGWHNSDLTIVGGRPAMGKTAFMLGLAEASSGAGFETGLISAEQPAVQIGIRRASLASGVGAVTIRNGQFQEEDWAKVNAGLKATRDRPLWIYDRSAITLDELIGIARKWKHSHDIKILFIDYAQRITVPGADRITEVSQVARGLKNLARDLQIPIIALAQVVKGVDHRPDSRPNAGDLANSDELTREADQILMLYRDEIYNRETQDKGIAEILVEKNRHGPTGYKRVAFLGETMKFADLAHGRWN